LNLYDKFIVTKRNAKKGAIINKTIKPKKKVNWGAYGLIINIADSIITVAGISDVGFVKQ